MNDQSVFAGPPICVVGNINRDVKLLGVPASPSLFEDGETTVSGVVETVGGGGANSACVAAALGGTVRFVGKVGADALGESLGACLERHGVSARLARDPGCATGTTVALGFGTGQRHFLSCLPNNRTLRFEELDMTALEGCAHLLRADVWFSQEMLESGNRRLLEEARRRGLATSLDINFDPLWSGGPAAEIAHRKQLLRGVLGLVDVAHGNVRELCEFTDAGDLETALARLAGWGVKAVAVHRGALGAGWYEAGRLALEPACPVARVVNSAGSGDVLSISLILLHHQAALPVQQRLVLANRAAAAHIEGGRDLIPRL